MHPHFKGHFSGKPGLNSCSHVIRGAKYCRQGGLPDKIEQNYTLGFTLSAPTGIPEHFSNRNNYRNGNTLIITNRNKNRAEFQNEKVLRETQTLRAGSSKAEPKNFAPAQTPFPGPRMTKI